MYRVLSLFTHYTNNYIGESITITEHSVRAACRAREADETEDVQLACLFHDIGHLLGIESGNAEDMDGCGVLNHEVIGADFLAALGFNERIVYLVRNHINSKRYLCTVNSHYYETLTTASKTTLSFQGGLMTPSEITEFKSNPDHIIALRCRHYDDTGKDLAMAKHDLAFFLKMARNFINPDESRYILSSLQKQFYDDNGYLVIKRGMQNLGVTKDNLASFVDDLTKLPDTPNYPWMIHHEVTGDNEVNLCRLENFTDYHKKWWVIARYVEDMVAQVYNEPAVLFKDKINFKHPGGGGFLPHQDATAYSVDMFATDHISVMVAIDDAMIPECGCLQMAAGAHKQGVISNANGVITRGEAEALNFVPLYVESGDVVLFSSYIPHMSEKNTSANSRRIAYLTYNKLSDGDFKEDYYTQKNNILKSGLISINDDFGGRIVSKL